MYCRSGQPLLGKGMCCTRERASGSAHYLQAQPCHASEPPTHSCAPGPTPRALLGSPQDQHLGSHIHNPQQPAVLVSTQGGLGRLGADSSDPCKGQPGRLAREPGSPRLAGAAKRLSLPRLP